MVLNIDTDTLARFLGGIFEVSSKNVFQDKTSENTVMTNDQKLSLSSREDQLSLRGDIYLVSFQAPVDLSRLLVFIY